LYKEFDSEKKLCDFERKVEQIIIDDVKERIPEIAKESSSDERDCRQFVDSLK
jgi:hypothetical protein